MSVICALTEDVTKQRNTDQLLLHLQYVECTNKHAILASSINREAIKRCITYIDKIKIVSHAHHLPVRPSLVLIETVSHELL